MRKQKSVIVIPKGNKDSPISKLVAEELQKLCDTPGCHSKFHLEEAHRIVYVLSEFGYIKAEELISG